MFWEENNATKESWNLLYYYFWKEGELKLTATRVGPADLAYWVDQIEQKPSNFWTAEACSGFVILFRGGVGSSDTQSDHELGRPDEQFRFLQTPVEVVRAKWGRHTRHAVWTEEEESVRERCKGFDRVFEVVVGWKTRTSAVHSPGPSIYLVRDRCATNESKQMKKNKEQRISR